MRKIFVIAVFAILLLPAACAPAAVVNQVDLGKEFQLSVNQTATIKNENMKVTFLQVTEDSRCPTGVQCVWEGRATSLVRVVTKNTADLKLSEPGLTASPYQYTFGDYTIFFHLQPYPEAGKQIAAGQYRLVMSISKE